MCTDYRRLNKVVVKNKYPLPRIDDLFNQPQRVNYLSKMDLQLSYHQSRVKEDELQKMTFQTRYAHYEFLVMSFGLTNALDKFMV